MHLVVSKNKNTWSRNDKLLFAGPWCYPKKDDNNESLILYEEGTENYHTKVDKQWEKIFEYKNKLFPLICSVINDYRKVNNTERYYRIIIGHWFDYAIEILYHKILLATKLKEIYNYKSFSYLFSENYTIAPFSESEFMDAHFDDRWNQALFGIILEKIKFSDLQIRKLTDHEISDFAIPKRKSNSIKDIVNKINYLFGEFSSNNDALIINSYLPFFEELKLKLFLKQIPIITRKVSFDREFSYNHNLRVEVTDKLLSKVNTGDKILNTILHLVFLIFPIIFLEGFNDIRGFVNKLNWPKNPKFIFTSNNFFADNVFKLWAAQKTKKNIKFFIGQHGPYWLQINSINNQVYSSCEEITADKLICNGFENSNNKIPGIFFPISKPKQIPFKKSGNISFIMPPLAYFG